ncbi:MAG: hypothetical protein VX075_04335, partial [Pseudomonadota bacterium]|nr:hypothetical protein [Pseudomonadota bacterium]
MGLREDLTGDTDPGLACVCTHRYPGHVAGVPATGRASTSTVGGRVGPGTRVQPRTSLSTRPMRIIVLSTL